MRIQEQIFTQRSVIRTLTKSSPADDDKRNNGDVCSTLGHNPPPPQTERVPAAKIGLSVFGRARLSAGGWRTEQDKERRFLRKDILRAGIYIDRTGKRDSKKAKRARLKCDLGQHYTHPAVGGLLHSIVGRRSLCVSN